MAFKLMFFFSILCFMDGGDYYDFGYGNGMSPKALSIENLVGSWKLTVALILLGN